MIQLILKDNLEKSKIDALLNFLKSWNVDVELKVTRSETKRKRVSFSLSEGIWKDYQIDSNELRRQAWNIK
jgi:hypothetical protein